jgi:hypothetical protein
MARFSSPHGVTVPTQVRDCCLTSRLAAAVCEARDGSGGRPLPVRRAPRLSLARGRALPGGFKAGGRRLEEGPGTMRARRYQFLGNTGGNINQQTCWAPPRTTARSPREGKRSVPGNKSGRPLSGRPVARRDLGCVGRSRSWTSRRCGKRSLAGRPVHRAPRTCDMSQIGPSVSHFRPCSTLQQSLW